MKIKPEHYQVIKESIDNLLLQQGADKVVNAYNNGQFPRSASVKDLQKRLCFDLLYAAGLSGWISDNVYQYANDDHLYTALKNICPQVTKQY